MTIEVSDKISNFNDQLANAARILGRSKHRQKVFEAIYRGKKQIKTQNDIRQATRLPKVRILQEGGRLAANSIVEQAKKDGQMAYKKVPFYSQHKGTILRLARDSHKLKRFPTKVNPSRFNGAEQVVIKVPLKWVDVVQITIDDIDTFSRVKRIKHGQPMRPVAERKFKEGVQKIIGEKGEFSERQ